MNLSHAQRLMWSLGLIGLLVTATLAISGQASAQPPRGLNDTGIVRCAHTNTNDVDCPVGPYPDQDAEFGRDADPTLNDATDGHAGFSFTKIAADGTALGAEATNWVCVRDNVTGALWEVKTDGGLRDKSATYSWNELDQRSPQEPRHRP